MEGRIGELEWRYLPSAPPAHLAPFVRSYAGYHERAPAEVRRRELPYPGLVMIVELEPSLRLGEGRAQRHFPRGFVAGIGGLPTTTTFRVRQRGLQVDLSPLGARALFAIEASELQGQVVPLEALGAGELAERLADAPDWPARFAAATAFFERRLANAKADLRVAGWLLEAVESSGGNRPIGELVAESGYSHGYLGRLCRRDLGLTPKQLSRLVRFQRFVERLRGATPTERPTFARLAADLGYADQSHLVREVRRLTGGIRPSDLLDFLSPEIVAV
jgi:AraC-like DNA-binding protein